MFVQGWKTKIRLKQYKKEDIRQDILFLMLI